MVTATFEMILLAVQIEQRFLLKLSLFFLPARKPPDSLLHSSLGCTASKRSWILSVESWSRCREDYSSRKKEIKGGNVLPVSQASSTLMLFSGCQHQASKRMPLALEWGRICEKSRCIAGIQDGNECCYVPFVHFIYTHFLRQLKLLFEHYCFKQ